VIRAFYIIIFRSFSLRFYCIDLELFAYFRWFTVFSSKTSLHCYLIWQKTFFFVFGCSRILRSSINLRKISLGSSYEKSKGPTPKAHEARHERSDAAHHANHNPIHLEHHLASSFVRDSLLLWKTYETISHIILGGIRCHHRHQLSQAYRECLYQQLHHDHLKDRCHPL
jgi:hypothetical protein